MGTKKKNATRKAKKTKKTKKKRAKADESNEQPESASRFDAFAELARRRAAGHFVTLPRNLPRAERHWHIRQTIREDHRERIDRKKADALAKFDKLHGSVFSFFRGTALLFYRDMAGEDAWMPTVLTLGDVHPENFGVMPSADNTPIFGVNDFDEAYWAPFTWDLKRGAVGFMVAAKEEGVHRKKRHKIVRKFLDGYFEAMERFDREGNETDAQIRLDNAPKVVRKLLEKAQRNREKWLSDYCEDGKFVASEKIVPITSRVQEFQAIVDDYRKSSLPDPPARAGDLVVKDVAEKKGSGTASLGLSRYFVLLEGPSDDGTDDMILEMKRARRSALAGLAPPSQFEERGQADRVVNAQAMHLVGGDPFYGKAEIDGESFLVRERSPFKEEVDLGDLSKKEWRSYAKTCGESLATAHALADEAHEDSIDIEPLILEASEPRELMYCDVLRFAERALKRLYADHEAYKEDHELGAFNRVDHVYE